MNVSGIITNIKSQRTINKVGKELKKYSGCKSVKKFKTESGTRAVLGYDRRGMVTRSFAIKKDGSQVHKSFNRNNKVFSLVKQKTETIQTHFVDAAKNIVETSRQKIFRNDNLDLTVRSTKSPSGYTTEKHLNHVSNIKTRTVFSPKGHIILNEQMPVK